MTEHKDLTFNPLKDLYYGMFRMAHIASRLEEGESMEIDRARIWDFYLLYPDKVHKIKIKRDEKDMQTLRSRLKKENNPYENSGNIRKMFDWLQPFQLDALKALVALGILSREQFEAGKVAVQSREALDEFIAKAGNLPARENNTLSFMSLFSRHMPMTGVDGLKDRTRLMETKYDAD